jgi:hypothetical protein
MNLASQLELERDHALDRKSDGEGEGDMWNPEDAMVAEANREAKGSDALGDDFKYEAMSSSATFDRVVYDGDEFGQWAEPGTEEELDFIGLPGLLEPEQVHELLTQRQARQAKRSSTKAQQVQAEPSTDVPPPLYRTLKEQRSLLNSLVGLYAKTVGQPHGLVHAELRRMCGGPAVQQASVTQLQSRIEWLRKKMNGRR